ncbi:hypothetical protein DL96DRAFT_1579825 [Flagelloscypha sp. PMI_526]|nr:hypothetical protein DL96DRAFT_1579825 [Flagelloscypha sp. PMI_526]
MVQIVTIDDLPPEILQNIFLYYVQEWHAELWSMSSQRVKSVEFHWENCILQVCQKWKEIAMSFTDLWAYLHAPLSPAECERHISLTAGIGLSIFVSSNNTFDSLVQGTPAMLEQICSRIASLEFYGVSYPLRPILLEWSRPAGAASLTHLNLNIQNAYAGNHIETEVATLLATSCPCLTDLELTFLRILQFDTLPPTLQRLSLHSPWRYYYDVERFRLGCLVHLLALRVLDLSGSYMPRQLDESSGQSDILLEFIELPSLETLILHEPMSISSIGALLTTLDTPPLLTFVIHDGNFRKIDSRFRDLCDTLAWVCQSVEDAIGDTLQIKWEGRPPRASTITIDWHRRWSDNSPPAHVHINFKIRLDDRDLDSSDEDTDEEDEDINEDDENSGEDDSSDEDSDEEDNDQVREVAVELCRAVTSEKLASIDIKFLDSPRFRSDDWSFAFGDPSLESLKELRVDVLPWEIPLLKSLSEMGELEGGSQSLRFPALQCLRLKRVEFDPRDAGADGNGTGSRMLREMLLRRRELGAGIEQLILEECSGLIKGDYVRVRELVGQLKVVTDI